MSPEEELQSIRFLLEAGRLQEPAPVRLPAHRYQEYIESGEWMRRRREAIARALGRCQVCNALPPLEVHHRTYDRLGCEAPEDLTVLCRGCHGLYHEVKRAA